jgi:hypothetical protein
MVPDDRLDSFASMEVTGCRLVTFSDPASPDTRSPIAKAEATSSLRASASSRHQVL